MITQSDDNSEPEPVEVPTEPTVSVGEIDSATSVVDEPISQPATTVGEAPTAPTTSATSTPVEDVAIPSTVADPVDSLSTVDALVAWTSFSDLNLDDASRQGVIDQLIASRTVLAVASSSTVLTLCAGVPIDVPLDFTIVWQFDGDAVQNDVRRASPPGTGSCLDNDGDPLAEGSYQVLATNDTDIGFATTFVVGATEVSQIFVNDTDTDICDIGVAPLSTAYYEFFTSSAGPVKPGEQITIDVSSIEQDLRARTCDGDDLESLVFLPDPLNAQSLAP